MSVYDVIYGVAGSAPNSGSWANTVAKWASADYIEDWEYKATSETWKPGDVIAKRIVSEVATEHCGIAVSSSQVVAAGQYKVSKGTHNLTGYTVRRYTGS